MASIPLGELSAAEFLRDYWQKKPLLIRGAFPDFTSPLTPDELAGLACEEGVEARLVLEKDGARPWELRHGPFQDEDFARLPPTHWSLLVQAVDRHVPEVADLLAYFHFIPSWRIDDLMISFAPQHGSVGPHTDSYDVFLLQAWGRRRWEISSRYAPDLLPDVDMKILRQFEAEQSWVVEPGDLLYLPPGIAHHGVALEDCMSFSVGFLAPTQGELIGHYLDHVVSELATDLRYADPELRPAQEPGELDVRSLAKLRAMIQALPLDEQHLNRWLGSYLSEPRAGIQPQALDVPLDEREWREEFETCGYLRRDCRLLYLYEPEGCRIFIDGEAFLLPGHLNFIAPLLGGQRDFSPPDLLPHWREYPELRRCLTEWTNRGWFYFYQD